MANKNGIVKLADGIYQIKYYWLGLADVYAYLILGKERGILIDTCYSITNISKYVREVTDLPVDVVNTHGHFDHIGGNSEFENVFLSEADWSTAKQHSDDTFLKELLENQLGLASNPIIKILLLIKKFRQDYENSMYIESVNYEKLPECGYFELGERKVTFIETPGHTQGSICLFDERSKYFFVGDMACEEGLLLCFDHSTSVEKYQDSIQKMKKFYEERGGKEIIPSHHQCPADSDIFERYILICGDIMSGKLIGKDQNQGKVVKKDKLQIVYKTVYEEK
ncbi:MAG: MBL fold metallo-hydrolase [Lachnospiraceae bacterium]|nr:MBL fold metallo-hydrolase [Lachnospiraceae bacterium]